MFFLALCQFGECYSSVNMQNSRNANLHNLHPTPCRQEDEQIMTGFSFNEFYLLKYTQFLLHEVQLTGIQGLHSARKSANGIMVVLIQLYVQCSVDENNTEYENVFVSYWHSIQPIYCTQGLAMIDLHQLFNKSVILK